MCSLPFSGNAQDSSGLGNNGTVYGASLVNDRFGQTQHAYNFDGNGDYIRIAHSTSLNTTTGMTISLWTKFRSDAPYYYPYHVIEKSGSFWLMQRNNTLLFGVNGVLDFTIPNFTIQYNVLYHLVITFNGSQFRFYVNGESIHTQNTSGTISTTGNAVYIGQYTYGGDYEFDGVMDDIRLYRRAITASEVQELYTLGNRLSSVVVSGSSTATEGGTTPYQPVEKVSANGLPMTDACGMLRQRQRETHVCR